ncbi:site-specific DNA-methyltransferase [Burkholderia contaminans]|uniref:site-specific DNA-methyltransferase n=1 Tax=Burkholderia contaminans TaxID=488447 RepID=UPI000B0E695D|nr:site-specific DNA-methyltransferase [Burkholderia contaminans]GLZ73628.1 hypothetical protein Bcon01_66730 [Burkholderia contaminans]
MNQPRSRPRRKVSQDQIVLPLLDCIENGGGKAHTHDLYDAIALKCGVPEVEQQGTTLLAGRNVNVYQRSVRWAQQRARLMGLVNSSGRGEWELTGKGRDALRQAAPGIVITIFTTSKGVALFGEAKEAVAHIDDGSLRLILTSPPYPLLREKQYGNKPVEEYLDWLMRIAELWPRKLADDGSVVLNLGDVFQSGEPMLSTYQERLIIRLEDDLGWKLCSRYAWHNPSKMPAPAEWVTVRRVRVKPSLEQIYWLAPNGEPYADNSQVLVPYSESMRSRIAAGGEKGAVRPSGHELSAGAFDVDNGGAIPPNLIVAANTESNSHYMKACREQNLPVHPARFPGAVPEHFIKLCTMEGDTVYDPFSGSFKTGAEAERLGRNWIGSELMLDYVLGGANRFPDAVLTRHGIGDFRRAADLFAC